MQIVLDVQNKKDLWELLQFIKSLGGVKITVPPKIADEAANQIGMPQSQKTVGDFIGLAPSIKQDDFEKYLLEIREEWNRPIS